MIACSYRKIIKQPDFYSENYGLDSVEKHQKSIGHGSNISVNETNDRLYQSLSDTGMNLVKSETASSQLTPRLSLRHFPTSFCSQK